MRRVAAAAARPLSTSALRSAAVPALSAEADAKRGGLLSSLFGGSAGPAMPPMHEPLAGVASPPYAPPAKAPVTQQKKLANGLIIAAEETPVRPARRARSRAAAARDRGGAGSCAAAGDARRQPARARAPAAAAAR